MLGFFDIGLLWFISSGMKKRGTLRILLSFEPAGEEVWLVPLLKPPNYTRGMISNLPSPACDKLSAEAFDPSAMPSLGSRRGFKDPSAGSIHADFLLLDASSD